MAAGGGVDDGAFYGKMFAKSLFKLAHQLVGKSRCIGVGHNHAVLLDVLSQLRNRVHQAGNCLAAAFDRADADHLSVLVHVNDRANAQHGAHGGGEAGHSAASMEKAQVVREEVHGEPVHLGFRPIQNLLRSPPGEVLISDLLDDVQAADGNALGVDLKEAAFGVFRLQLCHGAVHCVEGGGHGAGEVDIENVVPCGKDRLEILPVLRLADGAGGGQQAVPQPVVERMGVKGGKIHIGINGLGFDRIGHTDEGISEVLRLLRSQIGVGIGELFKHACLLLLQKSADLCAGFVACFIELFQGFYVLA